MVSRIAELTDRKLHWTKQAKKKAAAGSSRSFADGVARFVRLTKRASSTFVLAKEGSKGGAADLKPFAAFISYYREEGMPHARLLHERLEAELDRKLFLDAAGEAIHIDRIISEGLARSEAVLFVQASTPPTVPPNASRVPPSASECLRLPPECLRLTSDRPPSPSGRPLSARPARFAQTKSVLTRPWVLLELYEAVRLHIPVIPLHVADGGYDFEAARALLADLGTLDAINPGATAILEHELAQRGMCTIADVQV